jgi:hypothetical protein
MKMPRSSGCGQCCPGPQCKWVLSSKYSPVPVNPSWRLCSKQGTVFVFLDNLWYPMSHVMDDLRALFCAHPNSVGETYWVHAREALWISGTLVVAAAAAFVHAILPFTFQTTASTLARAVVQSVETRNANSPHVHPTHPQ